MNALVKLGAAVLLALACPAAAELQPEEVSNAVLAETMQPHWVWVNDVSFDRMLDGRAYLLDADNGSMLGMVSGGYAHGLLLLAPDGKSFGVPATYMARGARGARTDVVTFYKTSDLTPGPEAIVPPKRYNGMPFVAVSPVMPGGRFSLLYNFTPEQSVTVIDMEAQKTVGEFPTSGCGLVYPTSSSTFFLVCSDGALQSASLSKDGKVTLGATTRQLFAQDDPAKETAVWTGSEWLFLTPSGKVHVIAQKGALPKLIRTWSLIGKDESGWRSGGLQTAAYHRKAGRLYVLMHKGGPETHKDPGTEIWVYDAVRGMRLERIKLDGMASSLAVSQDDQPLLYTTMFGDSDFKIYDALTYSFLRKIPGLGPTMTVIQPTPVDGLQ